MEQSNLLANVDLNYPSAREWMWDYCMYLGPYTDDKGHKYDLGVWIGGHDTGASGAIVYGNEPGNYLSGDLLRFTNPIYKVVIERLEALNMWPTAKMIKDAETAELLERAEAELSNLTPEEKAIGHDSFMKNYKRLKAEAVLKYEASK